MMKRSKTLENTKLWQVYLEKVPEADERTVWIKNVYEMAAANLKGVCQEFRNYTLHDETHVLNVLDSMGGLLGDWIGRLTVGEVELLVLAASLHDLGMVYTEEEKELCFEDEIKYKDFLRVHCPELIGCTPDEWSEDIQQWYLRTLHPFRVSDVLQNNEWKALFGCYPDEIVPRRCVLAVCQAHGEELRELRDNRDLEYLEASDADPLFCALLLRLADLLDFDDTRAPKVLYGYVANNEKSREEWDKHQASSGFRYPNTPSTKELPYKARCKNPIIEHAVRNFLDWVDDELDNCARLQRYCKGGWRQEFPFPRAVLRSEIESDGYMSGDFCLTMDQNQVLKLLMGENLYDDRDVFVRELLQNAIDATLLRGQMDDAFVPENSRIDFWEWGDSEGNLWFRIDDQGTGMTLGMLQHYFLKVGNSYYTSLELKRDLRDHGQTKEFRGISRFGIGFLSCFLCGDWVEVSTLYFDPQKNRREEAVLRSSQTVNYGLRLQVTGLTGFYILKSQAEKHLAENPLPMSNSCNGSSHSGLERNGYRAKPGTSIVIRLNPGKLGTLNLRETMEKYLCGAKVPVYYNNKRVGRTYNEAMKTVHELAGEKAYELTPALKKKFDECFPAVRGNYPKLIMTIIPLDSDENRILPDLSGMIVKYEMRFDKELQWKVKDQDYIISTYFRFNEKHLQVGFNVENARGEVTIRHSRGGSAYSQGNWTDLVSDYGFSETRALANIFDTFSSCPQAEDELGEVWVPFLGHEDLTNVWIMYVNSHCNKSLHFTIDECGCPCLSSIFNNAQDSRYIYVYQGVIADRVQEFGLLQSMRCAMFILDGEWKPVVEVSRSKIVDLPLTLLVAICIILNKYGLLNEVYNIYRLKNWNTVSLQQWREVQNSSVGQWMIQNQGDFTKEIMQSYQMRWELQGCGLEHVVAIDSYGEKHIMHMYVMACLQDNYLMTINYEKGQIITFAEKKKTESEEVYDIFPPMMFCKAASEKSRKYICHADSYWRRGITVDHPFIVWLLENAIQINRHFERQFQQIVECLRTQDAEQIVQEYNIIREQLSSLSNYHGLDIRSLPQISIDDFWSEKNEEGCLF